MVVTHFDSFEVSFISAPALEAVVSEAVETVLNWPETLAEAVIGNLTTP